MSYGALQTAAPAADPVSLAEAKAHLRVTTSDEDSDITDKLAEAIRFVEEQTHRQLVRATWKITFDRFPTGRRSQLLPLSPLAGVTQIDYVDGDGTVQTISSGTIATDYIVTTTREPGYITPAYGVVWPIARAEADAVVYTITCGWANAAAVDPRATAAIKLMLGHLYENREETILGSSVASLPLGLRALIESLCYDDLLDYAP